MQLTPDSINRLNVHVNANQLDNPFVEVTALAKVSSINTTYNTGILNLRNMSLDFTFKSREHINGTKYFIDLVSGKFKVMPTNFGRMHLTAPSLKRLNNTITTVEGEATSMILNVHSLDPETCKCTIYGTEVQFNRYEKEVPCDGYYHVNLVTGECIPEALYKIHAAVVPFQNNK